MQRKSASSQRPRPSRPYMPGYDMMFDKKRKNLPWAWALKQLTKSRNYWLVSTRPDGRPHSMPVWGIWLDKSFFFCTGKFSRKAKNLEASASCIVCPDGTTDAVILEGLGELCSEPSTIGRFAKVYKEKYDYDIAKMLKETGDLVYKVRPRVVFGFVETPSRTRGNPTRWSFPEQKSSSA